MFVFRKIWPALFSSNTRFEIRPFALLRTKCNFLSQALVFLPLFFFNLGFLIKSSPKFLGQQN